MLWMPTDECLARYLHMLHQSRLSVSVSTPFSREMKCILCHGTRMSKFGSHYSHWSDEYPLCIDSRAPSLGNGQPEAYETIPKPKLLMIALFWTLPTPKMAMQWALPELGWWMLLTLHWSMSKLKSVSSVTLASHRTLLKVEASHWTLPKVKTSHWTLPKVEAWHGIERIRQRWSWILGYCNLQIFKHPSKCKCSILPPILSSWAVFVTQQQRSDNWSRLRICHPQVNMWCLGDSLNQVWLWYREHIIVRQTFDIHI